MFGRNGAKSRPARNTRAEAASRSAQAASVGEDMRQGAQK
jgi:hypothetical protein